MLNKIVIVLLVVVILAVGASGYFIYDHNRTINSLTEQLAVSQRDNTAQIEGLQNNLNSQLTAMNAGITSMKAETANSFTDLQNQIAADKSKFSNEIDAVSSSTIAQTNVLGSKLDSSLAALSGQISSITPGLAADKVFSKVRASIVKITDGTYTYGTGFLYDSSHVITAAHVIENISNISVILSDGTVSKASIVGSALHSDVAMLKLDVTTSLQPVIMAADNSVIAGDAVLTVGHPYDLTNSITVGVVSQIHRFENIGTSTQERWLADLIQFDAAANPGNSGGPLFDENGNVVGMVVAGIVPIYGSGVNFAVSSARINKVVSDLTKYGNTHFPMIGIFVDDITQTKAISLGLKTVNGALVVNLYIGSKAGQAGIQNGDIIMAIDTTSINCPDDIYSYFCRVAKPGQQITVHVIRNKQEMNISVIVSGADESRWWVSGVINFGPVNVPAPGIYT